MALTAESLRALAERGEEPLTQEGLRGQRWPEDDRRVLRYRAEALTADPASQRWLLHAAVDGTGRIVGRIGCHGAPVQGRVEVGYHVLPDVRRRGLATRLLTVFSDWLLDNGVETVVLAIAPGNTASLSLAERAGFVQVGEQWDEEDGRELVLERRLRAPGGSAGSAAEPSRSP